MSLQHPAIAALNIAHFHPIRPRVAGTGVGFFLSSPQNTLASSIVQAIDLPKKHLPLHELQECDHSSPNF